MIYSVHHLHCGTMCPTCAPLFGQKGLKAKIICHCLLIETDQGLVLVDTGYGIQDYLNPKQRLGNAVTRMGAIQFDFNLTAIAQIQQLGFQPTDVRHIFVSHLDFDHAGGISDFPHATVHILSTEYNAAHSFHWKNKLRYRQEQFKQHRHWNFIEPMATNAWFNFSNVQELSHFKDEILLIPLLGHTAGHCGIAIKQQNNWLLFCGDAYYTHLELDPKHRLPALEITERLFAYDNLQRIQTLKSIQSLASTHPEIEIICAHDPVELYRYIQS